MLGVANINNSSRVIFIRIRNPIDYDTQSSYS